MKKIERKLEKYFKLTREALEKVEIKKLRSKKMKEIAEDFIDMAKRYYYDAKYFKEKGDLITALAAISYAHAWLDAGARIGVFKTKDSRLFAAD